MKSARFASTLIIAGLLSACSDHPIEVGRTVYSSPRMPVRTLVETPPGATVPLPPTPELKPGSVPGLEEARAGGDADAELMAADLPPAEAPDSPVDGTSVTTGTPQAPAPATGVGSTANQPAGAQPPASSSQAVASTDDDPDHLVGLSEADALRLLGKPKSRADTPPSRVWTYSSTNCDLRLFFYPEIGGTSYRTLTYEIDDRDPTDTSRRNCVGELLKNHAS